MKKILSFTAALFMSISVFAQTPQGINYQGVARDNSGNALASQNIGIKLSVLDGSPTGTAVYSETFALTTDANGLFALVIGTGTPTVGTFAGIDWSTGGGKWLEVSMDAAGGTSYQLVGTSQLMSVPYALYAGSVAKSGGKQTLVLSDDVTDTQADSIITADVGPNTQEIRIVGTTALTTVDLSMIHNAILVNIDNNDALTTVNLSGLTKCDGMFKVDNSPLLTTLDISALVKVTSDGLGINNTGLTTIDLPNLTKCNGGMYFQGNASLTSLSLTGISTLSYLTISDNDLLNSISFSQLIDCENISITNNNSITSLSFPSLTQSGNIGVMSNPSLATCDFQNVTSLGQLGIQNCALLSSVNFTNLQSASGLNLYYLPALLTISFPALTNVAGSASYLGITQCGLSSINFPSLTSISTQNIILSQNKLTTSAVNSLLAQLVSISPSLTGKNIQLNGQTPAAPPSGQGITDKTTLINNGNNVQTD